MLLKNSVQQSTGTPVLPLKKQGKIALIGPMANDRKNIAGTWCVAYTPERYSTIKEAMERAVGNKAEVLYAQGSNVTRDEALQRAAEFGKTIPRVDDEQAKAEALKVARQADVIVCAMGECADFSGESSSRATLDMPDVQHELLEELVKLGKPVVLLNFSGRPTVLTWEQQHVDAIMNVWFGGSEAADAICDVLFGDKVPSGKLTVTMPQALGQVPLYYNYLKTGRPVEEGATQYYKYTSNYLDVRNDPLYPFGYGLSYTTFRYGRPKYKNGQLTVAVTNTGERAGTEVVQVYMRDLADADGPLKSLRAYQRVQLAPGETRQVTIDLPRERFEGWDVHTNTIRVVPGRHELMVGGSSADNQLQRLTVKVK